MLGRCLRLLAVVSVTAACGCEGCIGMTSAISCGPRGFSCMADGDCCDGNPCVDGVCRQQCWAQADCGDYEHCITTEGHSLACMPEACATPCGPACSDGRLCAKSSDAGDYSCIGYVGCQEGAPCIAPPYYCRKCMSVAEYNDTCWPRDGSVSTDAPSDADAGTDAALYDSPTDAGAD
jgi:hypothetical protein